MLQPDQQDYICDSVYDMHITERSCFGFVKPTPGFSVTKNFAQDHLCFDPNTLIAELKNQYGRRHRARHTAVDPRQPPGAELPWM
jgi:hypothetical protein